MLRFAAILLGLGLVFLPLAGASGACACCDEDGADPDAASASFSPGDAETAGGENCCSKRIDSSETGPGTTPSDDQSEDPVKKGPAEDQPSERDPCRDGGGCGMTCCKAGVTSAFVKPGSPTVVESPRRSVVGIPDGLQGSSHIQRLKRPPRPGRTA